MLNGVLAVAIGLSFAGGLCLGAVIGGILYGRMRHTPPPMVIQQKGDGSVLPFQFAGPSEPYDNGKRDSLRPYSVRGDGTVEFADGETIEPDQTKIRPPDMRVID